LKQIRRHFTYANVMSSIAVFMILGGATAVAASKIGANQLKANSVKTGKIVKEAVTAGKLKNGAVSTNKLADGAVTAAKLANEAVTNEKLGNGSVTGAKIANGTISGEKLATQYLPTSTQGVAVAGANVSATGVVRGWFNRFGGKPTVNKAGTGDYHLVFPGLEGQSYFSTSLSSATLLNNPGEISLRSFSGNPAVSTYNSAGAGADAEFMLTLILPGVEP